MTTIEQPELTFPSAPIEGDTKATVDLVANDWRSDEDWLRFEDAVRFSGLNHGFVDPNNVRSLLSDPWGYLTIEPRRYSAFWSRAAGKNGFLVADGWVINDDVAGGNRGKPLRRYRLRVAS